MTETFSITLLCDGRSSTRRVPLGTLLADVLRAEGLALPFDCGGRGRCGRCAVPVRRGEGESFEPRLACQTRVDRDGIVVDLAGVRRLASEQDERRDPSALDAPFHATDAERRGPLAAAVDLGTTTLEAALVSLASGRVLATTTSRNPQSAFGRDVVSRIAAAAGDGAATMRRLVCEEIGRMAETLVRRIHATARQIEDVVVAGNTTMEFLLTGRDPAPLGVAPFAVGSRVFPETRAEAYPFGVELARGARVRVFPVFSAFVGGDILSGFEYLRGFGFGSGRRLFLDVGTNGETLLSDGGRFYATSTAAGPAFEGAEITQGSLAIPGAIVAIEYDATGATWRARTYDGGVARSVCGSGLVDALAGALDCGFLSSSGRLASSEDTAVAREFRGRLRGVGRFRAALLSELSEVPRTGGVWLSQGDARHAQLALCAIKTGRRLMHMSAGVDEGTLDSVELAGAFGGSLNVASARRVGMLPQDVSSEKVRFWGNTSLLGAVEAATGRLDWSQATSDASAVETLELATLPEFADVFASCASFNS